jgi:hypothetical protein
MLSRRKFVTVLGTMIVARRRVADAASSPPIPITVYKSSTCGCCTKWVDHIKAAGFAPQVHDNEGMDQLKDEMGVPGPVRSCHTAIVGGYLIEGHVPASDIRKLLASRPLGAGLAVPGMPAGTPGMAESDSAVGDFEVLLFQADGSTQRFARH